MASPLRTSLLRLGLATLTIAAYTSVASAHFLWIVSGESSPDGKVHVYFSESATPDDASLLDKVNGLKVWSMSRGMRGAKFDDVAVGRKEKTEESLSAETPKGAAVVGLTHDYGVMSRGGATFLLRYSAKTYPTAMPGTWQAVGDAERATFEIVPKWVDGKLQLTALAAGKPLAGSEFAVSGAGLEEKKQTADAEGRVFVEPTKDGVLSARAKRTIEQKGELDGKAYPEVRHYATIALPVKIPQATSVSHKMPPLGQGITSFGAAVAGDWLYVYGGHFGGAHHYAENEQSGDFQRLNLKDGAVWEKLPGGPKRTGLAMVAHEGIIYRVGGFVARNKESEDQDLASESDAAKYDPATKNWTALPSLPSGRSSLDAAVLDGRLYAIGGWTLAGKEKTVWHNNGLVYDLASKTAKWEEIPVPFHRRALSVAAHDGKLYAIGGMQEQGGPTTRVDVFDPKSGEWSEGPSLLGGPMDGFGNSSFASGGKLYVSTMSGSLQRLSSDGKKWEVVGQLDSPRFFHRMLPWTDGSLVAVGGASMQSGKVLGLELLTSRKK